MMTIVAEQRETKSAQNDGDEDPGNPRNFPASHGELSGMTSSSTGAIGNGVVNPHGEC